MASIQDSVVYLSLNFDFSDESSTTFIGRDIVNIPVNRDMKMVLISKTPVTR